MKLKENLELFLQNSQMHQGTWLGKMRRADWQKCNLYFREKFEGRYSVLIVLAGTA